MNKVEEIKKCWDFLLKAQQALSVRFTGNEELDKIINKAYADLDLRIAELRDIYKDFKQSNGVK